MPKDYARTDRIGELIQRELAKIIAKEIRDPKLGLISVAALFVGATLSLQTVVELQNYEAQDYAGAVISIGLLRELGPLIVGVAWTGWLLAKIMADIDSQPEILEAANRRR